MDHRSPLDSFLGVLQAHDKPVKQAIYNAVAILLLILGCAATWGLYVILQPFVKPLMWAVLIGSALHPLKRSLRDKFRQWFSSLEANNTPTILGVVLLPMNILNEISELIGQFLWVRIKLIVILIVILPVSVLLYKFTPTFMISGLWMICCWLYRSLNTLITTSSLSFVALLVLFYITLVLLVWTPTNNTKFHYASIIVWLIVSSSISSQFASFQMPIFLLLQIVLFGGFIAEIYEVYATLNAAGQKVSITELLTMSFNDTKYQPEEDDDSKATTTSLEINKESNTEPEPWSLELFNDNKTPSTPTTTATGVLITNHGIHLVQENKKFQRSFSQPQFNLRLKRSKFLNKTKTTPENSRDNESTFYLYGVMWCCLAMLVWKNIMLLLLLPFPILWYIVKHVGNYLGLWQIVSNKFWTSFQLVQNWCLERHDALVPIPIRGLYKVANKINATLKNSIKNSIDVVASFVVISGLIFFVICASTFICLQIYTEGIMLVQMTSNVINRTVVSNPELRQLLPPTWDDTMDSILDNAYQYGREGISKAVRSIMTNAESIQSEKLEKQILELWDRIYQSWMTSHDGHGPKVTDDAVRSSWEAFVQDIQKSPELFNINGIVDFAKQNVGMLMSVLESIWSIVISNISLVIGSFSTCVSIVLGGGTAVLNFILNTVVFLTTLFYLLNSSGNYYKPVQLMTQLSPSGKRFGHALEAAINSVFSASVKMAIFYGMWTWLIHNLFNVHIVYLSTAVATILGAVPFLGTYWACVPGILDLWLSQERWMAAILFAGCQFLPTSIVDTTIYKEIKGGHPYLTGLAIAGGIFCMGVEGAIIGPLLLCALYVAIDLSSNFFKDSPTELGL